MQFVGRWFDIETSNINDWHESLGLGIVNQLTTEATYRDVELVGRLVNAILYFRQAANQSTPEMQMSTLWICVESFFTANNESIVDANIRGLLAIIMSSLNHDYWPNGAKTPDELGRTFSKFYQYRSRTIHHGRRGHVSRQDVQEFSLVVSTVNIECGVSDLHGHAYDRRNCTGTPSITNDNKEYEKYYYQKG